MKLKELGKEELRDLERVLGLLLIDEPDILMSKLQEKIQDKLGI